MKLLRSISIPSSSNSVTSKCYQFFKKGKGDWKIECHIYGTKSVEEFAIDKFILASKCALFETQFYGENADVFLKEEKSSFVMTQQQFHVLYNIIIPYCFCESNNRNE